MNEIVFLTCPQVESVEGVGVEVVSGSVWSPVLPTPNERPESLGVRPADAENGGQVGARLALNDHHLKIPLLVHGRALTQANKDVGTQAGIEITQLVVKVVSPMMTMMILL